MPSMPSGWWRSPRRSVAVTLVIAALSVVIAAVALPFVVAAMLFIIFPFSVPAVDDVSCISVEVDDAASVHAFLFASSIPIPTR